MVLNLFCLISIDHFRFIYPAMGSAVLSCKLYGPLTFIVPKVR